MCVTIPEQLKQLYFDSLDVKPSWPIQPSRVRRIYNTMARPIKNVDYSEKENLLNVLLEFGNRYDDMCRDCTASQSIFNEWFAYEINNISSVPFHWTDKRDIHRSHITFGLAQKFLNLIIKDWWCKSEDASKVDCSVLHAPYDNKVRVKIRELIRVDFPSRKQGGFSVYLTHEDYDKYQKILTSPILMKSLSITRPLTRIEVEQMLWGS